MGAPLNGLPRLHLSCFVSRLLKHPCCCYLCCGAPHLKSTPQINHTSSLHVQLRSDSSPWCGGRMLFSSQHSAFNCFSSRLTPTETEHVPPSADFLSPIQVFSVFQAIVKGFYGPFSDPTLSSCRKSFLRNATGTAHRTLMTWRGKWACC